mmetsp:Transcript_28804/g.56293  ORF Transcript_28804/g.56293 Transcript_28804/m.56293 type:complete len:106 (+) Transcript_28804:187-504(+)
MLIPAWLPQAESEASGSSGQAKLSSSQKEESEPQSALAVDCGEVPTGIVVLLGGVLGCCLEVTAGPSTLALPSSFNDQCLALGGARQSTGPGSSQSKQGRGNCLS